MAQPKYQFGKDPVLKYSGKAMLAAARAYMDEYALEIFDLWFSGTAPPEVVFDNPKWAAYMAADEGLAAQIDGQLTKFAREFRDKFFQSPGANGAMGAVNQPYKLTFHAEVGSATGGYRTGYSQLHGTDRTVGDFQIEGVFAMMPSGGPAPDLEFRFINNQMTFNDRVNPNYKYKADAVFANVARNLAAANGGPPPKDFTLRIRWREAGPWVYRIPAAVGK
jgi:hypothetical protein